jgi:alpha-tubulin suppressor-like RCC1 family protein
LSRDRALLRSLLVLALLGACTEVVEVLTPPSSGLVPGDAGLDSSLPLDSGASGSGGASDAGLEGSPDATSDAAPRDAGIVGTSVDCGDTHTCATQDGRLYCWGAGSRGRLGLGDATDRTSPVQVGIDADWEQATAAAQHSCARRADGSVFCFGANDLGQLGVPAVTESFVPVQVTLPAAATFVVAESNTTCALLGDKRLFCWGENTEGQLGLGDGYPGENHFEPIEVASLTDAGPPSDYAAVDTGQGHVCAVRDPGELYCWGRNTGSQLGQGPGAPGQIREPTRVGGSANWLFVQAGQDSGCAINDADELYCWGNNSFANLGTGDRDNRDAPTLIAAGTAFSSVSIDTFHACGLGSGGTLRCWGRGIEGQLGTGDLMDQEAPAVVSSEVWKQVAVGRFFTCAVRDDEGVYCTGENSAGQLGQGDTERRNQLSLVTF